MFEDFQFSGILLCYGPLLLTILGFIGFAYLTDNISTRTYLRNLDPRPEAEQLPVRPARVSRPTQVLTPTGARVTFLPEESPAEPVKKTAPPDDLSRQEDVEPSKGRND